MYILEEATTTILISLWFSSSAEAAAITDIAGCGNNGLYITKPKDLIHDFDCYLVGSGLEPSAPNLGQLAGRPPHWDLDEIPVIAAGFFDSEPATST
jgi:hypothetical protein